MATIGLRCSLVVLLTAVYFCLLSSQPTSAGMQKYNTSTLPYRRAKRSFCSQDNDHVSSLLNMAAWDAGFTCIPRQQRLRRYLMNKFMYQPSVVPPEANSFYSSCPEQTYNGDLLPLKFDVGLTTFVRDFAIDRAVVKVYAKNLPAEMAPNATDPPITFSLVIVHTTPFDKYRDVSEIKWDTISTRYFNSEDLPLFLRLNVRGFFDGIRWNERMRLKTVTFGVGIKDLYGRYLDWRKYLVGVDCSLNLAPLDSIPEYRLNMWGGPAAPDHKSPALDLVSYRSEHRLPLCPLRYSNPRRKQHDRN